MKKIEPSDITKCYRKSSGVWIILLAPCQFFALYMSLVTCHSPTKRILTRASKKVSQDPLCLISGLNRRGIFRKFYYKLYIIFLNQKMYNLYLLLL